MAAPETLLCRYVYDALDRLTGLVPSEQEQVQRFYNIEHLVTELQGQTSRTVFQQGTQLLALQQREGDELNSQLLATDQQRSVLHAIDGTPRPQKTYTPYGHRRAESGLSSLLGFNGERPDPVTGHYLLGNGHRAFNPVLMRFNSPDRLSPFGRGGLNPYAYCLGDPVNFSDPTGREAWQPWMFVGLSLLGFISGGVGLLSAGVAGAGLKTTSVFASAAASKKAVYSGAVSAALGFGGAGVGVTRSIMNATDPGNSAQDPLLITMAALSVLSLVAAGVSAGYSFRAHRLNKAGAKGSDSSKSISPPRSSVSSNNISGRSQTPFEPSARPPTPGIDLDAYDWMSPEIKAALNNFGGGSQSPRNSTPRNSITEIRRT
ncbi:RHS repeat-associated core domain-containing protein [Pseudomonas fluorescens]|uniref:Teneurin-like YD-shell domain-containing protein n=1 Tax=Pseudomonas fluorescens TaxID=294 RepID=A0A5E7B010_PSEFL|nr:RHS repeat-associated core domain-containing protein [Pseudomonas fluorescens]VVN84255.1 hypothetical protein PS691_01337 [Pseudomonas fluorescens]